MAAVKLPLADNASLLCWWLAAQALSGRTAALIAWAGYNLLAEKNNE